MMQSVVLDGNPLNEDEDMRLLTCVVLDGKPPDEVILDLMSLVNDDNMMWYYDVECCPWKATHLMKMMTTYLMKLCLREYVPDEENMMFLQYVQKAMKKGIQNVLKIWWNEYVSLYTRIFLGEVAYARGNKHYKSRMGKKRF